MILGESEAFVENLVDRGELPAHHRSFFPGFSVSSVAAEHVMAYLSRTYRTRDVTGP